MLNPILVELAVKKARDHHAVDQPKQPPNYRLSLGGGVAKCQSCDHFAGGHCKKFDIGVDPNYICDEYKPMDLKLPPAPGIALGAGVPDIPPEALLHTDIKMSSDSSITPEIHMDTGKTTANKDEDGERDEVEEEEVEPWNHNDPGSLAKMFGLDPKLTARGRVEKLGAYSHDRMSKKLLDLARTNQ